MTVESSALASGQAYMRALRRDHAGLSRMLREIDTHASRLTLDPEQSGPLLVEALGYLLRYHHAFHHPREDRLFARIQARDAGLQAVLEGLSHEHESGELSAQRLADDLAAASPRQLKGRIGASLVERLNDYVGHTRAHMRHEEAVFYARAEQVLDERDWQDIIAADHGPQDPMVDLAALGGRYPLLAEQLGLTVSQLGLAERVTPMSQALRLQMLALTDLYGGLINDAVDLTRGNLNRLLAVRGPTDLVRACAEIGSDNLRFAGQCLSRPPRWAINGSAALIVACLKPYLRPSQPD